MDGLSLVANVVAVVELPAEVASLCAEYSKAVKNAKSDITRLHVELTSLEAALKGAQALIEVPDGARLQTTQ